MAMEAEAEAEGAADKGGTPLPGPTLAEKYPAPGMADTVAHGVTQGASYGLADEAQGVLGAGKEAAAMLGRKLGISEPLDPSEDILDDRENSPVAGKAGPWARILEAYKSERNDARKDDKAAAAANPKAAVGSLLGGAVLAPGPKGAAVKGVIPRALSMAKTGAKTGAAFGAGDSESDLTEGEWGGVLGDALTGAGVGGVAGALLGGASAKAEPWFRKLRDSRAFQAMKPRVALGGLERKMAELEAKSPAGDKLAAQRNLGARAFEEGLVKPLSTAEDIANRAAPALKDAGVRKGAALQTIQDANPAARVSLPDQVAALEAEAQRLMMEPGQEKLGKFLLNKANGLKETVERRKAGGLSEYLSLPAAEEAKTAMQGAAKYVKAGPANESQKMLASRMRQAVEDEAEAVAGPDELEVFKALKARYGELADINDIAGYGAARAARQEGGGLAGEIANRLALQGDSPEKSLSGWAKGQALDAWKNRRPATMANIYDKAGRSSQQTAGAGSRTLAEYFASMKKEDE